MRALLLTAAVLATCPLSFAQSAADEASGDEPAVAAVRAPQPLPASASRLTHVLAVPESTNDNVILLDPDTGDVLTLGFLTDNTGLSTPINAIPDLDGDGLLVCDQIADAVYRFSGAGQAEGLFAPAGGVNTSILDNVRGCTTTNDTLLVASAGASATAVAAFSSTGASLGPLVAVGTGALDNPFDVLVRPGDILVADIDVNAVLRYARDGSSLGTFATGIDFPEQLHETASGTVLVADFTSSRSIFEFAADGTPIGTGYTFGTLGGFRGVYEMPSGALLVTTGNGVFEVLRNGTIVRQIVSGVSARFIERIPAGNIVASEPAGTSPAAALRVVGANPFRLETTLALTLDAPGAVRVEAFDATGRRVAVLFDGVLSARTPHLVSLRGTGLPAGVYAVRATGPGLRETATVTHVR